MELWDRRKGTGGRNSKWRKEMRPEKPLNIKSISRERVRVRESERQRVKCRESKILKKDTARQDKEGILR